MYVLVIVSFFFFFFFFFFFKFGSINLVMYYVITLGIQHHKIWKFYIQSKYLHLYLTKYTHGNKLGNTCNNVTTNFGLYTSFFVKIMRNVLTIFQNL